MRNTIAAALFLIAFSASAGTITSIDNPSIRVASVVVKYVRCAST